MKFHSDASIQKLLSKVACRFQLDRNPGVIVADVAELAPVRPKLAPEAESLPALFQVELILEVMHGEHLHLGARFVKLDDDNLQILTCV